MDAFCICQEQIVGYQARLCEQERERSTIEKYGCCVTAFVSWLDGRPLTKEEAVAWKEELKSRCASATVNASLAALNGFFRFIGECSRQH